MSESVRMWVEVVFNVTYLVVVWTLVVMMTRRLPSVAPADRPVAVRFTWAFALLALGDTGHVGFRVLATRWAGWRRTRRWSAWARSPPPIRSRSSIC